jgi:hypothetical protein
MLNTCVKSARVVVKTLLLNTHTRAGLTVVGNSAVQPVVTQSTVGARHVRTLAVHTLTQTTVVVQVSAVQWCTNTLTSTAGPHTARVMLARESFNHVLVSTTQHRVARARLTLVGGTVQRDTHTKSPGATVLHGARVMVITSNTVGVGLQHAPVARSITQRLITQCIGTVTVALATVFNSGRKTHSNAGVGSAGVAILAIAVNC